MYDHTTRNLLNNLLSSTTHIIATYNTDLTSNELNLTVSGHDSTIRL